LEEIQLKTLKHFDAVTLTLTGIYKGKTEAQCSVKVLDSKGIRYVK